MKGRYDKELVRQLCRDHGVNVMLVALAALFFSEEPNGLSWAAVILGSVMTLIGMTMVEYGIRKEGNAYEPE